MSEFGLHTSSADDQSETESIYSKPERVLDLDAHLFSETEIDEIQSRFQAYRDFNSYIERFNYEQLVNILDNLVVASVVHYRLIGLATSEKDIRNRLENLLDFKGRTGCPESIESCLHEGCFSLRPSCAMRKVKEDIFLVTEIFESRKNRSHIPHVAIELFFKQIIENHNCIGIILSDKTGAPKVFTTDGSSISSVISEGTRRLADAVAEQEFRFSDREETYIVFNQRFAINKELADRLVAFEKNPELARYIKFLVFASIGLELAHERMILSILYMGDNLLRSFLRRIVMGVERIKIETDPEARLRSGFATTA
ncbi:MAG: hypothetical protein KDC45_09675 [Bacteroidetes bacterium]|nr:hypothetical protein [Bacteroidota bacterium]